MQLTRRRTSTPSAVTTCRRPTSGRSCASTCRSCTTRTASTARPPLLDDVDRRARRGPALPALSPTRDLDLRRAAPPGQPDRPGAGRGPRAGARQPGAAARARTTRWLVACWFAVLKAGGVVVTTMPLLRAGELAHHRGDRRGRPGAVRPPLRRRPRRRPAWTACGSSATAAARDLDDLAASEGRHLRRRRDRRRRRGPARLHLGHHRPAQGDHALPPRRARDRRHVLAGTC